MRTGRPFIVDYGTKLKAIDDNYVYVSSKLRLRGNYLMRMVPNHDNIHTKCTSDFVYYPVKVVNGLDANKVIVPREIRSYMGYGLSDEVQASLEVIDPKKAHQLSSVLLSVEKVIGKPASREIDAQTISKAIREYSAANNLFKFDQTIVVQVERNCKLVLRVNALIDEEAPLLRTDGSYGQISELTSIELMNNVSYMFTLHGEYVDESRQRQMSEIPLDFVDMGVGGHKDAIQQIIRRVFFTRAMKQELLDAYGVKSHSKGILLYGPPGTGKTLIAKSITELFTDEAITIVEGPQLKSSYYGASQQNVANIFRQARENPEKLFVYLFDEIDALMPNRGGDSSVSTSNNNDIVSRFLSILDGANKLDNIVIIGTTNRKELIDEAVLRPGRIETHIHIGLPNELGRLEILQVHTKDMQKVLADDVDLAQVARLTKNYSGAELAQVVAVARGFALQRNFTETDNHLAVREDIKSISQLEKVTQKHFLRALDEVKPAYGVDQEMLDYDSSQFIYYTSDLTVTQDNFKDALDTLRFDKNFSQLNFLIHGEIGVGKSMLAKQLAMISRFNSVQVLTASKLLPLSLQQKLEKLDEIFVRAKESTEPAVIILDSIENLLEATPDYMSYNNMLRIKLDELLKGAINGKSKLLVIATSRSLVFMEKLGLAHYFHENAKANKVTLKLQDGFLATRDTLKSLSESMGLKFTPIRDNDVALRDKDIDIQIPIKELTYSMKKYAQNEHHSHAVDMYGLLRKLSDKYSKSAVTSDVTRAVPAYENDYTLFSLPDAKF